MCISSQQQQKEYQIKITLIWRLVWNYFPPLEFLKFYVRSIFRPSEPKIYYFRWRNSLFIIRFWIHFGFSSAEKFLYLFIESTTVFNADAAENEMKRKGLWRNGLFGSRDSKCFLLFSINANLVSFGLREWIQLRYTLVA